MLSSTIHWHSSGRSETVIPKKGFTLSGGREARIALTRAVFSRTDMYVLNAPPSATDCDVVAHISRSVWGTDGMLQNLV